MRTLSTYFGTAVIVASLIGCVSTDPNDILTTVTSATLSDTATITDTDTDTDDTDTETGTDSATTDPATDTDMTGDGDGDATTTGDGDGDPSTTDDGSGCFGCPCGDGGVCDEGLECADDNTCQLPEMTTDDSSSTTNGRPTRPIRSH